MSTYNYSSIGNFGSNINSSNELNKAWGQCMGSTIDQQFNGGVLGALYGQYSNKCQQFMADQCCNNWDGNCEVASQNINKSFPNIEAGCGALAMFACEHDLTAGEMLIRNAAARKYRVGGYW